MTSGKNTALNEFTKPPVVEAWIEFDFDLSEEDNIPWTEEIATKFIEDNFPEFSAKQFQYYARIDVDSKGAPDFSKTDKFFHRVKAFSEDGQYCIQAGRNVLILNQTNIEKWPGYNAMRDKAFNVLDAYSKYRGIDKLLRSCLHYRDKFNIPSDGNKIELNEYFKVYPQLNDPLGDFSQLKLELTLPDLCDRGLTSFALFSLPDSDEKTFKFQMDWHIIPKKETIMNFDETKIWLDNVHSDLIENFEKHTFTEKTIDLFKGKG